MEAVKSEEKETKNKATLYLIPVTLGDTPIETVLPPYNKSIVAHLTYFAVENVRSARRFLKKICPEIDIDSLTFYELSEHTDVKDISECLVPLKKGHSMGVISEAGCPAVADPGSDLVSLAHKSELKVVPLAGPSSIIMALMASGFSGQNFAFNGYLPAKSNEREARIRQLENRCYKEKQTQVFIETPYRNEQMFESLIKTCRAETLLCIASNITCENECIATKTVFQWKKSAKPNLHKIPTIFLISESACSVTDCKGKNSSK